MADGIDKLSIEVSSSSASAADDLKKLSGSLEELEKSTGDAADKIKNIAKSLLVLQSALNGLKIENIVQMTDAIKRLSAVKLNDNIKTGLKSISSAIEEMPADVGTKISEITGLKVLSDVSIKPSVAKNLVSIGNSLNEIPNNIDSKIGKLTELTKLSEIKLSSTIPKNIKAICEALKLIPDGIDHSVSKLMVLKQLNEIKLSSLPTNLSKLGMAIRFFPAIDSSSLKKTVNTLNSFRVLEGMKLTPAINAFKKLPGVIKEFNSLDVTRFSAQLAKLNPGFRELASSVYLLKRAYVGLPAQFKNVATAARNVTKANKELATSNQRVSKFTTANILKTGLWTVALYKMAHGLAYCVNQVNTYIENMNLFEASMGKYTESATEFGQQVQSLMGIDFADWARNEGVFQTLITGMGEATDNAAKMSKQLTQLGYDISSFYNIDVEDAMVKLQSGIAGELEPLRRLGWDLSNARMQLLATEKGIEGNVSQMTQAQKVALRYYLIMTQVTQVHGDMARTIQSPANQLRVFQAQLAICARAIGNLFIPALNAILPYAIALVKAFTLVAQSIAEAFGIDIKFEVDYSGLDTSGMNSGINDTEESLEGVEDAADGATDAVEELKRTVLGFDELNKLNSVKDLASSATGDAGNVDNGLNFNLPIPEYDFLDGLDRSLTEWTDEMAKKMASAIKKIAGEFKTLLPIIAAIGTALAAWKIANDIMRGISAIKDGFDRVRLAVKGSHEELDNHKAKVIASKNEVDNLGRSVRNVPTHINFTTSGLPKIVTSVAGIGTTVGTIGTALSKMNGITLAGIAVTAGIIAGRFVDLYMNNDQFRRGLDTVGEWFANVPNILGAAGNVLAEFWTNLCSAWSNLVETVKNSEIGKVVSDIFSALGSAFGSVAAVISSAWQNVLNWLNQIPAFGWLTDVISKMWDLAGVTGHILWDIISHLGLDFADFGITALGVLGLLIPGFEPFGVALLVFEGISLALRAIGYACEPVGQEVDILAGVSEDTASRFGTSIDSMKGAIIELDELDFSNRVVSEEDVTSITTKVEDIKNAILNNLDADREQELADLSALKYFLTDEEYQAMLNKTNQFYDEEKEKTIAGADRIFEILSGASKDNRGLWDSESEEIKTIVDGMWDKLVETSGASSEDMEKITTAMNNNQKQYAKEAASTVIKAAWKTRDDSYKAANDTAKNQIEAAKRARQSGDISEETYNRIVAAAKDERDAVVKHTEEKFKSVMKETKDKLGETAKEMNFWTGEEKKNWEKWSGDVREAIGGVQETASDDEWSNEYIAHVKDVNEKTDEWLDTFTFVGLAIPRVIEDGSKAIGDLLEGLAYGLKAYLNLGILVLNGIIDGVNWVIELLGNCVTGFFGGLGSIDIMGWKPFEGFQGYVSTPQKIPHIEMIPMANGGFIDEGQLFVAREQGPELVGRMGSHNAVANNQQIVDGIEAGVMRAMIQAAPMFGNENKGDVVMVLQVGAEQLAKAVNKGNASMARRGQVTPEFVFV